MIIPIPGSHPHKPHIPGSHGQPCLSFRGDAMLGEKTPGQVGSWSSPQWELGLIGYPKFEWKQLKQDTCCSISGKGFLSRSFKIIVRNILTCLGAACSRPTRLELKHLANICPHPPEWSHPSSSSIGNTPSSSMMFPAGKPNAIDHPPSQKTTFTYNTNHP